MKTLIMPHRTWLRFKFSQHKDAGFDLLGNPYENRRRLEAYMKAHYAIAHWGQFYRANKGVDMMSIEVTFETEEALVEFQLRYL